MVVSMSADDVRACANWPMLIEALREGHKRPPADIGDTFVHNGDNTMLVRSAYVEGVAAGVKAATVVPENPNRAKPLPSVHAQVMLFEPTTGQLFALVDGTEVTAWKTAADSALGCDLLARKDVTTLAMVGAGSMAEPLIRAHRSVRPSLTRLIIWNRSRGRAEALAARMADEFQVVEIADDLDEAVGQADVVCSATMTRDPIICGAALRPGTHLDLVGAFKADMREADDECHRRGRWFVDSRATTLGHIGELKIPLETGLIERGAICGDLHELVDGSAGRAGPHEITIFKNGGGAHLDVMVSAALVDAFTKGGQTADGA